MQKNLNSLLMILLGGMLLLLGACQQKDTPEEVAEKFLTLLEAGNVREAKELCVEKTKSFLDLAEDVIIQAKKEDAADKKVVIISSEIDGDKALVKYVIEGSANYANAELPLDLVKVDGEWKVSFNKEGRNKEN